MQHQEITDAIGVLADQAEELGDLRGQLLRAMANSPSGVQPTNPHFRHDAPNFGDVTLICTMRLALTRKKPANGAFSRSPRDSAEVLQIMREMCLKFGIDPATMSETRPAWAP